MFELREIASELELPFEGDRELWIVGLAGLADARAGELSFVSGPRFQRVLAESKASAVIAPPGFDTRGLACLRSAAPYADFARCVEMFHPRRELDSGGVHARAVVAPDAQLGEHVSVAAGAVIGSGVRVGDRTRIHANATLYPGVVVGQDCEIHSGVHLREGVQLGDRVTIQNGTVIGAEGFGFAFDAKGRNRRVPHRSGVRIGNDCDIGSNCTIDASHPGHARGGHEVAGTHIGNDVKIDNLVHIAHGCEIGDGSVLCAHVALAGSTVVGKRVYMLGAAVSAGHLRIGDGSVVGARSGVSSDLEPGSHVQGTPHMDQKLWVRWAVARKKLPGLLRRMRRVEERLGLNDEE